MAQAGDAGPGGWRFRAAIGPGCGFMEDGGLAIGVVVAIAGKRAEQALGGDRLSEPLRNSTLCLLPRPGSPRMVTTRSSGPRPSIHTRGEASPASLGPLIRNRPARAPPEPAVEQAVLTLRHIAPSKKRGSTNRTDHPLPRPDKSYATYSGVSLCCKALCDHIYSGPFERPCPGSSVGRAAD